MMILSSETYRGVKITLEKNNMELVSVNPDLGDVKDNIEIEFDDKRLEMGFNSRYFIEVFQSMYSEEVEVGFIDNASPSIIKGDNDSGFLGLIMPMRI
jgi:DNA polymerase-3 subunit beta